MSRQSSETVTVDRYTLRILAVAAVDAIKHYREQYGPGSGAETETEFVRLEALKALGLETLIDWLAEIPEVAR